MQYCQWSVLAFTLLLLQEVGSRSADVCWTPGRFHYCLRHMNKDLMPKDEWVPCCLGRPPLLWHVPKATWAAPGCGAR